MLNIEQTMKTLNNRILRDSPLGTLIMQMAVISRRLNAADPTIVPGPNSPDSKLRLITSMQANNISGADVPSAINVRLATVSFHTRTSMKSS